MNESTILSKLLDLKKSIYAACNLNLSSIEIEKESCEYGACKFIINNKQALFRIAKITPTQIGQFVTFWKRNNDGITAPFDFTDPIELFIITAITETKAGQFVFPKSALLQHDVISNNNTGGKRGMRVYPPWDKAENKQAIKTQAWQLAYFFEFTTRLDCVKIKRLFV